MCKNIVRFFCNSIVEQRFPKAIICGVDDFSRTAFARENCEKKDWMGKRIFDI